MGYIYGYAFIFIFLVVLLIWYMVGRYVKMINTEEIVREADQFVRDHLLIEFMKEYYMASVCCDVEDIYEKWIYWLKKKEESHA